MLLKILSGSLPQIQCVNRFFVHSLLPFQLDVFLSSRLLYGTPGSHARSSVDFCDMEGCGSFPILIQCHRQTDPENSDESTFTQPLYVVLPVCWTSKVVNECRAHRGARCAFQHCCFLMYCLFSYFLPLSFNKVYIVTVQRECIVNQANKYKILHLFLYNSYWNIAGLYY